MKTYKLNGFEVVVCCDPMHVDLGNGKYHTVCKASDNNEYLKTGLWRVGGQGSIEVITCPHCQREVEVR